MKKKNLVIVALASATLVIAGGAALATTISTKAIEVKAATNKTFGFLNGKDWGALKAYAWKDAENIKVKNAEWPGVDVTTKADFKIDGKDVYTFTVDTDTYDRLIFNNNSGSQTEDLDIGSLPNQSIYVWNADNTHGMAAPHTWGVVGNIDGVDHWGSDVATGNSVPWTQANAIITVDLKEGDTFKIRADSAWTVQLNGEDLVGQNGTYFEDPDTSALGSNARVKTGKSGRYTFEINWSVESYGDKSYGVSVTNFVPSSTSWTMRGDGNIFDGGSDWSKGLAMTPVSATEVKIENITLAIGDEFKFTDGSQWFGWKDVKSDSPINENFVTAGSGDRPNIKTKKAGTYTFFVDTSASLDSNAAIWITQQAYVDIDGWCKNFLNVTDFCDAGDTDWATYSTSFSALSSEAQGIFNDVTANADEHASNIERAAARYDYAVGTKGKTAFAGGSRAKNALFISPMSKGADNGGVAAVAITAAIGVGAAVGIVFIRRRRVL